MSIITNLVRLHQWDWRPLAKLLDDPDTGRFLLKWFPDFKIEPQEQSIALLSKCKVLMTPEQDVALIFEPHHLGYVLHVLALPEARQGKAFRTVESGIAWGFLDAGFTRILGVAPVDHHAMLKLALKAGMKFLHKTDLWEVHHLDALAWMTDSPFLRRIGATQTSSPNPSYQALMGLFELTGARHPLALVAHEIIAGLGCEAALTQEV